jgi:hypothetical protein
MRPGSLGSYAAGPAQGAARARALGARLGEADGSTASTSSRRGSLSSRSPVWHGIEYQLAPEDDDDGYGRRSPAT